MKTINIHSNIRIYWKIWRGINKVSEQFDNLNTELRVFLVGSGDTYWLKPTINTTIDPGYDVLELNIDAGRLGVGAYDLKAIWKKNEGRDVLTSMRSGIFGITDNRDEAPIQDEEVRIVSYVDSYGRDGMSAYETAVFRGLNDGSISEKEWIEGLEAPDIADVNVTVDNKTGKPSATASIVDSVLNLHFTGLKGEDGEGEYVEIVDNLEDGGSDKALSAEQGKLLMLQVVLLREELEELRDSFGGGGTDGPPTDSPGEGEGGDIEEATSCFGSGEWIGELPWVGDEAWVGSEALVGADDWEVII